MTPREAPLGDPSGEPLLQVRCGVWRALLPLRAVERVLEAALPSALPANTPGANAVVAVGREVLPVVFGEALLGAQEVGLRASHKMVELRAGGRRALLWVSAVEDVVSAPQPSGPGGPAPLGVGGAPVIDVARVLEELAG